MLVSLIKFSKMQGLGNDYIYLNCLEQIPNNPAELSIKLSDRHFGIGADGLVLIMPSTIADFRMRMFNADGSEAQMCGNASRCVAKYIYERGLTSATTITLETAAGIKTLTLKIKNSQVELITVNLGAPILEPQKIPVNISTPSILNYPIEIAGQALKMTCVSMGNPHAVFFVDQITDQQVLELGPKIERLDLFPQRTNVEFVQVLSRSLLKMRVWERGSGETLACGTGAGAVCVAAALNNLTERQVKIQLLGGELQLDWAEDNQVYKTGPAEFVFEGEVKI
jgi:diaminopimelate epimerase